MVDRGRDREVQTTPANRMRPVRLGGAVMLVALLCSGAIGCSPKANHTLVVRASVRGEFRPEPRTYARAWDPQYGFGDSLVLQLVSGPSFGEQRSRSASRAWFSDLDGMSLGTTAADGRVWLRLHGALDVLNERGAHWPVVRQDSILLGAAPVMLRTRSSHGGTYYALRVRRGAVQTKDPRRRVSIRGVVRSKWTGEWSFSRHGFRELPPGASALVTVAYGDTFTFADSTGAFELRGVPEGRVRIHVVGLTPPRKFGTVVVDAPDDPVTVLVDDDEQGGEFFIAPPAQAIEVLVPGRPRTRPADPHTVPGTLEWLAGRWEGVLQVIPTAPDGTPQSVPITCQFSALTPGGDVRLVMRDASSPTGKILAEHAVRKRHGPWGPLRDLYDAVGTQWRYRAVGDSLLGLELDSPGGSPLRRLHVRRLSGHERVR